MRCRRPAVLSSVVVVAAVSLLAAGCGGGSSTTAATTAAATTRNEALAFSHCMHSHGVPNFPDPNSSGQISKAQVIPLVSSPQFQPAQRACVRLNPYNNGSEAQTPLERRQRTQAGLAFARCMRRRGFPDFPDPTAQGQLSPQMVTAAAIDLHQPAVLNAGLACTSVTHGLLTPAAIRRAVNGG